MTLSLSPGSTKPLAGVTTLLLSLSMEVASQGQPPSKLWSGDVEIGIVSTSGNTDESTAKTRTDINRESESWRYNLILESLNSESNGLITAEKYFFGNRLAYLYTDNNFVFGYVSYDDDRFSGFDYQTSASIGWGHRLINNEIMQWDVEVGPGYRYSKVDDNAVGDDSEELILRGYTKYIWDFSETANFSQSLNVEAGDDNTISKSITALKVQVIGSVSLKLSYSIKYSDTVPVGNKHADTETAVTINYTF